MTPTEDSNKVRSNIPILHLFESKGSDFRVEEGAYYSGAGEEEEGDTHSSVIWGSTSRRLGAVAVTNWNEVSSPEVRTWPKSADFEPCACP
jgi:hypothetical protein